jgi:hypothetical protein
MERKIQRNRETGKEREKIETERETPEKQEDRHRKTEQKDMDRKTETERQKDIETGRQGQKDRNKETCIS